MMMQTSDRRHPYLLRLADALRPLTEAAEIQEAACRVLGEHLVADRVNYAEVEQDEYVVSTEYRVPGLGSMAGRYPIASFRPEEREAFESGRTVQIADLRSEAGITAGQAAAYEALGVRGFVSVPLVKNGRLVVVLSVIRSRPGEWLAEEVALIQETGERTWSAVERGRAEAALRKSERRLRLALDAAEMGTYTWYPSEDRTDADARLLRLWGLPPDAQLTHATAMAESVHPEDRERHENVLTTALDPEGNGQFRDRIRVRGADGIERWIALSGRIDFAGTPRQPIRLDGLAWDVTEQHRVESELRDSEDRLRRLNEQLEARVRERTVEINTLFTRRVAVQEEERRRIARDIHDQLGQQMTALRMNLEVVRSQSTGQAALVEQAERTQRLAEELDHSIDVLTWELRPAALDHLGLSAALRNLVTGWSERLGVQAEFDVTNVEEVRLPREVEANLYRIAQEALHNIAKHALAEHVTVYLTQEDGHLLLLIEDDGRGFDRAIEREPEAASGMGLVSMRERTALIGGQLTVESVLGEGTSIYVRIPAPRVPA